MVSQYIAGIDVGGTWIRVAVSRLDLEKDKLHIKATRNLKEIKYSISKSICNLLYRLLEENNLTKDQLLSIGLASAGPLDMEKGEVFNNANLGFKRVPLKGPISEDFPGIPINLINDCNAAVLGVHYFEASEHEKKNLVYVTLSTGIGGGAICNGQLLLGKEGNAAEIGHGKVEPQSDIQCNCGAKGCWEVFSSGTGVKNRALEFLEEGSLDSKILMNLIGNDKSKISAKEVFMAAKKGDELSQKVVNDCVFYTKVGIGLVNNFYDCSSIYLGGAMMKDKDQILPPIQKQFKENPIEFTINHPPKIKHTTLADEVGLRGAIALAKHKLEKNPIVPTI
ncbi:MAG: ROK family protein [Promethearchaeia archaeon]